MALWHDIAARVVRWRDLGAPKPGGEALIADTEAGAVKLWAYRGIGAGPDAPVYVHFPDTGFIHRRAGSENRYCRQLAEALSGVVLCVDLDPAPEVKFPKTPQLAQAVIWWVMMAGRKQGWDAKRLALGGVGTGANLAIGACLELPARMGVKPKGVVASMPVLDLSEAPKGWRAEVARAAYLPDKAGRLAPLASPLLAETLAGFAPALIVVGEGHPRRGEGEAFAAMLDAAGCEVHLLPVPRAEAATGNAVAFLARTLAVDGG